MSLAGYPRHVDHRRRPPRDRLSIQTNVVKFDAAVISRAIRTEMERGGQVYFVNNRVESTYSLAISSRASCRKHAWPSAAASSTKRLGRVMVDFVAYKCDVLLATTIIENGLDIPNANTIIVNRADRYGLSQLSSFAAASAVPIAAPTPICWCRPRTPCRQSRRSVWRRSANSAIWAAVFAWPRSTSRFVARGIFSAASRAATSRRSAGSYEAPRRDHQGAEGRGNRGRRPSRCQLRVDLRVDETYIPDVNQRLTVYRRMAAVRSEQDLDRIMDEVRIATGRPGFGPQPCRIRCDSPDCGPDPGRIARPGRTRRRPKVQARREAGPGLALPRHPGAAT